MARGYPDFFGFSVFPSHGGMLNESSAVVVPSGPLTEIVRVTGKGVLDAVSIIIFDVEASVYDLMVFYFNDLMIAQLTWYAALITGSNKPTLGEPHICGYDPYTPAFRMILQGPLSFDTSVSISYQVVGANPVTVIPAIKYSLYR